MHFELDLSNTIRHFSFGLRFDLFHNEMSCYSYFIVIVIVL